MSYLPSFRRNCCCHRSKSTEKRKKSIHVCSPVCPLFSFHCVVPCRVSPLGRVSLLSFHLCCLWPPFLCLVHVCNLARGEARFDSWVTFDGMVVPLLGWYVLALHSAFTCLPQKIKNLPDAGQAYTRFAQGSPADGEPLEVCCVCDGVLVGVYLPWMKLLLVINVVVEHVICIRFANLQKNWHLFVFRLSRLLSLPVHPVQLVNPRVVWPLLLFPLLPLVPFLLLFRVVLLVPLSRLLVLLLLVFLPSRPVQFPQVLLRPVQSVLLPPCPALLALFRPIQSVLSCHVVRTVPSLLLLRPFGLFHLVLSVLLLLLRPACLMSLVPCFRHIVVRSFLWFVSSWSLFLCCSPRHLV